MTTISLCMIVKNEEKVLARCLDSLQDLMDEIIIVDTGSQDQTREIALKYTDNVCRAGPRKKRTLTLYQTRCSS